MLTVEILVQAVVIARFVPQQQWRGPKLARAVAARDECVVTVGKPNIQPHRVVPAVRDRGERRIKRTAQLRNEIRQGVAEVLSRCRAFNRFRRASFQRAFALQQRVLALDPPSITRKRTVVAHYAMTWNRHRKGVGAARLPNRPDRGRRANALREVVAGTR